MNQRGIKKAFRSAAVLSIFALGACDDDGTGPGLGLTPEDVAGVYEICTLTFDPAGTIVPPIDILQTFEFPGGVRNPQLGLDPNSQQTFELTFIPKGQVTDRELRGTYRIRGATTVELRFNASGVDPKTLLIPENRQLSFEFQASPLRLWTEGSAEYTVTREAYVALSDLDPDELKNLQATISGVLIADFRSDGCGG
ncbi:MAG TPA: hypothetical protein VF167_09855 [Longimicrobiaceae bacterium]